MSVSTAERAGVSEQPGATTHQGAEHPVQAKLTFIVRQKEKPYFESSALTGGEPRIHFQVEQRAVTIHNMRTLTPPPSIDQEGFELLQHQTQVDDLYDDTALHNHYNQELETLLLSVTGAQRVTIFDHTRRSDAPQGAQNPDGPRGPASRVHVDYTVKSGPQRARDALGAERVDTVLGKGGRIVQINVWRPIQGPVQRTPLALAAAKSIRAEDLIATDQRFPDRVGEIYNLAYGKTQRWYYAPLMQRDEVLLIKGWDSLDDGRARFTPHGAFELPETADKPPRESIETRTYLVFESP